MMVVVEQGGGWAKLWSDIEVNADVRGETQACLFFYDCHSNGFDCEDWYLSKSDS